MTNQEAFDKVYKYLMQQKEKSIHKTYGHCVYAGDNGNACAVGCLLPRELCMQLDQLDCPAWRDIVKSKNPAAIEAGKILRGVSTELLTALQRVHDREPHSGEPRTKRMHVELADVAHRFELTIPCD